MIARHLVDSDLIVNENILTSSDQFQIQFIRMYNVECGNLFKKNNEFYFANRRKINIFLVSVMQRKKRFRINDNPAALTVLY